MGKRVVVGMSGGVDSSVAACLLQEQGMDVIGVTIRTWQNEEPERGADATARPQEDAGAVARLLHIPHRVVDYRATFLSRVVDYFVEEYLRGRTPNPCIACNRYVKWEALLSCARAEGADYIATGHYARIERLENGRYALRACGAGGKDQTYALYGLTQRQLSRTLMPLGDYTKEEIRHIATARSLPVADKPDSQEICFIPDGKYARWIEREVGERVPPPGNFVTEDGRVLGRHAGITHYTVGQRKGLNLALGHPVFVTHIRPDTNEVVIGAGEDVFSQELECNHLNCMAVDRFTDGGRFLAKIRYGHQGSLCTVRHIGTDSLRCTFDTPVRAVTPGQAVVFYTGEYVAGGGIIV